LYIANSQNKNIFLMCGADRADDLTDKDIPNSIKKCALENLKGMEEENFCTFNCLFKWYDECSIVRKSREWFVFSRKKKKRNKNPSR